MSRKLNIVIIEDVPHDADAIESELREASILFQAQRVETAGAFKRVLQESPPDIVLSDFTLPEFDGWEALRLLRSYSPNIPFILVTGTRSEEVAVDCIKEGADDYILKASLKRLPSSVLNALAKKASERAKAVAEAALRRSEEQFRLIAENSQDLIGLTDLKGGLIYASPAFERCLGFSPDELVAAPFIEFVHEDDRPVLSSTWQAARERREGRTVEFRARHRNGHWVVLEAVGNWFFDEQGVPQHLVMVCRDVTRRKETEAALRELPRLIREAQETERRRVARELHDSVNQILSSVKFRIASLEEKLAPEKHPARGDAHKAGELLEKTMQEVRRISRNLRPSELDDLGLTPAVRSLCQEFEERTRVQVSFTHRLVPKQLSPEVELHLYRIIQEALNNIEKHARAQRVYLSLARENRRLVVTIRDDGCGFDPDRQSPRAGRSSGMGLTDMRERATFVGGLCAIATGKGRGTEVRVDLSLPDNQHSEFQPREKRKSKNTNLAC